MGLRISRSLLADLQAEAAASRDEICGLLFGSANRIEAIQPCRNVAARPADSFEIDPAALFAAHRAARAGGPRIVGHYHSHPEGTATPSERDADAAVEIGAIWLILTRNHAATWRTIAPGRFEEIALELE